LFVDDGLPSLALAHGASELHAGFTSSILDVGASEISFGADDADEPASAQCSAWIADDRRKTFLAQVGVGTVDQAILSVLPSRHQSLRLIGLAQRVLILDEVHAYDSYVSEEIVRLLEFHAALGGSAILLSATLPAEAKARLLRPYGGTAVEFENNYPLATVQSAANLEQTRRDPRPDTVRSVPLHFVATPREGLDRALAAARQGQAVLYIRNTVADAIETYRAIPGGVRAMLFHARFALCDRLARQADALSAFDKESTPYRRAGCLLIATQVVEQSLDLDFDLIVSDLAPIDLIIQRAGRLWRHATRQRHPDARCEMIIVGPEPSLDANTSWLSRTLQRTVRVYDDHARMWLTAEALRRAGSIDAPGGC
jgi:CRISPR-associated endonuclease/helicase Cas3